MGSVLFAFEAKLREMFRTLTRAELQGLRHLRTLFFNGDMLETGVWERALPALKFALPGDVRMLEPYPGDSLYHMVVASGMCYDRYGIILWSRTWKPINAGDYIPVLSVEFQERRDEVGTVLTATVRDDEFPKGVEILRASDLKDGDMLVVDNTELALALAAASTGANWPRAQIIIAPDGIAHYREGFLLKEFGNAVSVPASAGTCCGDMDWTGFDQTAEHHPQCGRVKP